MDNIKTWTALYVEESIRMTEDRDKRRNYVHGVANPRLKKERKDSVKGEAARERTSHPLIFKPRVGSGA